VRKDLVKVGIARDLFDEEENLIIPGDGLKLLDQIPNIRYEMFAEYGPEITPAQVRDCDMVISAAAPWTANSLVQSERLIAVLYTGVGFDHIDVECLTAADVMLCSAPDAVRRPMAVTILTHLLAVTSKLINKDRLTREGRWEERTNYKGEGVTGKTLGCIGVGNIGHELLLLAQPFGMRLLACDPYVSPESVADLDAQFVDMDTLLAESDFVSLSVPLNDETHQLIGADQLKQMKPTGYLINTSRGGVVDEIALIEALKKGRIRGAGLDVFEQEPVDSNNPLLKMDNVVVTPHSLCHTDEYFMTAWTLKLNQAQEIMAGKIPAALVNKTVLEKESFKAKLRGFLS
jgi:D-3-phosphoglycerate dehydrogenase|tara:strand:- start:3473 stop:4510 length:1038 start_codon:yes stop_codon:yes gene_type:complete